MLAVPELGPLLERAAEAAGAALVFVSIVLVVYLPGRFLVVPLARRAGDSLNVEETFLQSALKLLSAAFAVFGLYLAIPLSGLATTPTAIAGLSAGATIALGFASRDVLGNLVSGVFIVVDPTFHIGDWIVWKDKEGIIEEISFRTTRVHTFDNELITVPNSELTQNAVVNPVQKDRLRITFEFGIGYDDDVEEARDILIRTADENEEILDRPRASVRVMELGESAVVLNARFWIANPARTDFVRIRSDYVQAVKERFETAGIDMPYPTRTLTGSIDVTEGRAR